MAKLNTNSNAYIIAYSCVMVVIVAFLLAFISSSLKPTQDVNVALDKKKQILAALNIRDLSNDASAKKYQEVITADAIVDPMNFPAASVNVSASPGRSLWNLT